MTTRLYVGTSYITVACPSARRWFDLDAVRGPGSANTHARLARGIDARPTSGKKAENPNNNFGMMDEIETSGAPPLDWWDDGWHTVRSRLIDMMCPRQVCLTCGRPRERIVEYGGGNMERDELKAERGWNQRNPRTDPKDRVTSATTLGWSDCGHDNWRQGVAFDPFSEDGDPMTTRLYVGDVRDRIADIGDGTVDLVLTSPPFWGQRDYGGPAKLDAEMGSEGTPADFLDALLDLTVEFRRVLAPHGSIAIELGDTYSGSGGGGGDYLEGGWREGQAKFDGSASGIRRALRKGYGGAADRLDSQIAKNGTGWPLAKSLALIPQLYPASLAYGRNLLNPVHTFAPWRVRNIITWCRPNPPVGALGDKVRPATSYITVACPSARRWFDLDAVRTEYKYPDQVRAPLDRFKNPTDGTSQKASLGEFRAADGAGAPPLDWWDDALDPNDPTDHMTIVMPTQPYPGAHYACVDDQTEALTPFGWRRHGQLRDGDLVAAYDKDAEVWRFEPATFHRYPFDGDMVAIDKRVTNQRLTPNHRVLYRTRKDGIARVREAGTLTSTCYLPLAAEMEMGGVGPGEKAAAIVGWFVTEGGIQGGWPVIYQSESANPEKVAAIRSLLDGLGATYTETMRERTGVTGKQHDLVTFSIRGALAEWLRQFHKNLPTGAVFGWSEVDARALFDAMVDGDGHRRPDGRMSFIQKSLPVAEAFQMLATRLGYRSTLTPRTHTKTMWTVYVSPGRWIDLRAGRNGLEPGVGTEPYVGTVWCPSVPSTFWIARRNGQPFITGNTWPAKLAQRLIDMMCPRQVCTVCGRPSERIVDITRPVAADDSQRVKNANGQRPHDGRQDRAPEVGWQVNHETLGWSNCGCRCGRCNACDPPIMGGPWPCQEKWRPGHVLDPFAGSGTTLAVAMGMGRDATGIELYPANADLIRDRVGMFLEEEPDHPIVVDTRPL